MSCVQLDFEGTIHYNLSFLLLLANKNLGHEIKPVFFLYSLWLNVILSSVILFVILVFVFEVMFSKKFFFHKMNLFHFFLAKML